MADDARAKNKRKKSKAKSPARPKKKPTKKKQGPGEIRMRKGTVLGYVSYCDEPGWWPDLEWDPKCFVPIMR